MNKSKYLAIVLGVAAATAGLAQKKAGDAAKGKEVFEQSCAMCHNADTAEKKMGPGLKGLFKKGKLESNGKPATEANVVDKINEGGNGMPPYKDQLTDGDRANLVAYLKTL